MMRRSTRWIVASLVAGSASLIVPPTGVDAADGSGSGGASDGTIWAGVQTGTPPTGGSASDCSWTIETAYDSSTGEESSEPITKRIDGIDYVLYARNCGRRSTSVWIPQLSAGQLARQASVLVTGRLGSPPVRLAPPADANVVTVGTWIWVDRSWWRAVSATAWLPTPDGIVWARTTATPVRMTFRTEDSLVDGGPRRSVVCDGPGDEWSWGSGDDLMSSCSYTYRHASSNQPGGRFEADLDVEWSISWESNAGSGGSLPPHTTSTSLRITVQELHALVR